MIRYIRTALHIITAILICEAVGFLGAAFTIPALTEWYPLLQKPSWNPPAWIFGPVWTLLYTLMGVSAFLIWKSARHTRKGKIALLFFSVQLLLNLLWSVIFFGSHSVRSGLIEILFLLVSLGISTVLFWRIHKTAAILLFPYCGWTLFATILNFTLWRLNG